VEKLISDFLHAVAQNDDELAEATAEKLTTLPEERASQALQELSCLIASPEASNRWWGVRGISSLTVDQAAASLVRSLDDENPSVRQCAALGLRTHPNVQAIPVLINALSDEDRLAARLASDALVSIGEPAVPPLLEVVNNGDRFARLEAVRALASIGDQRSIPALFTALDDDSALVEYWANEGLERMGVGMKLFAPE
jgi:HEAT repeat protein